LVELDGKAVTLLPLGELRLADGVHVYVLAPPAVKVVELPLQMKPFVAVTFGNGFTVTVTALVPVHMPFEPVTVYVCVAPGTNATPSVTPPVQV
jgi:hypothetical protein